MRSITTIIAAGLDDSMNGRGMSANHVAACKLANQAPELLIALRDLLSLADGCMEQIDLSPEGKAIVARARKLTTT